MHWVLAKSYEGLGRPPDTMKEWTELQKNFPDSPYAADALLALARAQMKKGDNAGRDAAYELFRKVEAKFSSTPALYEALWGFAQIDLADGNLQNAQKTMLRVVEEAPAFPQHEELEKTLGDVNLRILRSPVLLEGEQIYEIQKGDAPVKIGKKFKVNYQLIMMVNGISDPSKLRIGQKLKIPNIEYSILVDKTSNTLTLRNHGKFFKRYRVRTGKDEGQTPTGNYSITLKEKDPAWYHEGKKVAPLAPDNELGTRWMAFQGSGLGIHGTIDPTTTIGQYASQGCVGMSKEDVEELYDLVPLGTPVEIVGQRVQPRKRGE